MNALEIELFLNSTNIMAFSQTNPVNICKTLNAQITVVDNFKYLGSLMNNSLQDFEFRKALARRACHKTKKLWKSDIVKTMKIRIVKITIETMLLNRSETCTINKSLEKRINDATPNLFAWF